MPSARAVDSALLASLANQTGGVLAVDDESIDPKQAGTFLARPREPRSYGRATSPGRKQFAETFPTRMPPLRSDRDTIVVGRADGKLDGDVNIAMTTQAGGKSQPLRWTLTADKSNDAFAFLPALVEAASRRRRRPAGDAGHAGAGRNPPHARRRPAIAGQTGSSGGHFGQSRHRPSGWSRKPCAAIRATSTALDVKKQFGESSRRRTGGQGRRRAKGRSQAIQERTSRSAQAGWRGQIAAGLPRRSDAPTAGISRRSAGARAALLDSIEQQNRLITGSIRAEVENELREARAANGQRSGRRRTGTQAVVGARRADGRIEG